MPCYREPPTREELERERLVALMDEIQMPSRGLSLDQMTDLLCQWCRAHNVKDCSLELQIWWRDHQRWDERRKAAEAVARKQMEIRRAALDKLTPEERAALGFK